ncbi:MAG: YMGG-like glycine zipper-containing protein [Candidatus Accumulibacter sp. UW20]|jgi:hypothetical protein
MRKMTWLPPLAATFLMGGCMSVPTGPTVMVLPGQQKSLEQFRSDDIACQQYALTLVTPAGDAAVNRAAGTTAASTAIGAVAGAVIGSASGQAGQGAAIGAGTGLLFGSAAGGNTVYLSSYDLQRRYDVAYVQCMYTRGNQVPRQFVYRQAPVPYPSSQPASPPVYPPPNMPPPVGVSPAPM